MDKFLLELVESPLDLPSGLSIPNRLALAPMAGTSNKVYRQLCKRAGAGFLVTELVSCRGIIYDPDLTKQIRYLDFDPDQENPLAIQLFGSEPEDFSRAICRILSDPVLSQCACIDLNLGCPVNKVVKQGAGAALLRDPEKASAIFEAAVAAASRWSKPVSVKFRTGWSSRELNYLEIGKRAQEAGVAMVTLHARTREQFYSGQADWQALARLKHSLSIPVWGNGDLTGSRSLEEMYRQTGVDGFMIGRAAQGAPWLFSSLLGRAVSPGDKRAYLLDHFDGIIASLGEDLGVREFRSQLAAYTRGLVGAAGFRKKVFQISDAGTMREALSQINFT